MSRGFFTRSDKKPSRKAKVLSPETAHRLGLKGVEKMNPRAKTIHMPASGSDKPLVYVLGEAPGEEEDKQGYQFVGASGKRLRRCFVRRHREEVRFNNVVQTRPPANRDPKSYEIECYRPTVLADIEKTKPKAILAVGRFAFEWCTGLSGVQVKIFRGRRFKAKLGSHCCWVYPVMHPAFVGRIEHGYWEDVPGSEWSKAFRKDVRRAFFEATELDPPEIIDTDKESLHEGVWLADHRTTAREVVKRLKEMIGAPVIALDFETKGKRPYAKDAEVVCIGVGTPTSVISFPLAHPKLTYSPTDRKQILDTLKALLVSAGRVVAQNLAFELEWLAWLYKDPAVMRMADWDDTMVMGYVLDERVGGLNLNFLTSQYLGVPVKNLTGVSATRPHEVRLSKLLFYNALDVKFTLLLRNELLPEIKRQGLNKMYREVALRRVPTLTLAQWFGMPFDASRREEFLEEYKGKIEEAEHTLRATPGIQRYEREYGSFNPGSSAACAVLFRDVLHRAEGEVDTKTGYTTKEEVLQQMKDCEEAMKLLAWRGLDKIKGTYIDPMDPKARQAVIWPDGKFHCSYSTTIAATGRTSSYGPNMQNWPARKNKELRAMVAAPEGSWIVGFDYGQIEHRIAAILSKDRAMIKALKEGLDVHQKYAKRLVELYPPYLERHEGVIKAARSAVKNRFVFPSIYGAGDKSKSQYLDVPISVVKKLSREFWVEHKGVARWQRQLQDVYDEKGYVDTLSDRRRRAPLSHNMVLNTPVQALASDLVVNAMDRISEHAQDTGQWWMHPRMNIHDDLTFIIPDEYLEDAIITIVDMMLDVPYDWVTVPITVEVKTGRNWADMEEVGNFSSDDMAA